MFRIAAEKVLEALINATKINEIVRVFKSLQVKRYHP